MKYFSTLALILFFGVIGFISWSFISQGKGQLYHTIIPKVSTINHFLKVSGFVYPNHEVDIKPQLSGVVDEILVHVGEHVNVGTPIISVRLVASSSEIEQLSSNVRQARINMESSFSEYERGKMLYERKSISRSSFEALEKDYNLAKENYETAEKQLSFRALDNIKPSNIVRSSMSGVVIDLPVSIGTSVMERSNYNAGTTIATLADSGSYVLRADVPEQDICSLHIGDIAKITLLANDSLQIIGEISKIAAKSIIVDGSVRFPVEICFNMDESRMELRSGYSAIAEIMIAKAENVLCLPENCISFRGDTAYVHVTNNNREKAWEKDLILGLSDGNNIEICSGLDGNEYIITNWND